MAYRGLSNPGVRGSPRTLTRGPARLLGQRLNPVGDGAIGQSEPPRLSRWELLDSYGLSDNARGMQSRRIAILMHEQDDVLTVQHYIVSSLVPVWQEDGHEVIYLFGTKRHTAADLLFMHVDLSVVPRSYVSFAQSYPAVVNGRVSDIRKSSFSSELLGFRSSWKGPVIVKSNLNYAGAPERRRGVRLPMTLGRRVVRQFRQSPRESASFESPADYRIFDDLDQVPRDWFRNPELVVQKFLPEIEEGKYCVRIMTFLGDQLSCYRLKGSHPIVNGGTSETMEIVEPHPEMVTVRERLHFDYGKFDYVISDGRPVLLDINKTIGLSPLQTLETDEMRALRQTKARALYSFFR